MSPRARSCSKGDVVDEIVAYADVVDADLIVLGSRGHGSLATAALGSVSQGVPHEARRPALVVRGTHAREFWPVAPLRAVVPMTVLVAYASKYGSTQQIAETIGRELRLRGLETDVRSVGGMRGHRRLRRRRPRERRLRRALALERARVRAGACRRARRSTHVALQQRADRPAAASTDDDAVQIDEIVEATGAKEHRLFPGRLDRRMLNRCEWAVVFALRVKEGDYRDEGEVSAWARDRSLAQRQPSSSPSASA